MSNYVLSPRAVRDLEEIWDWGAEAWGRDAADRYARVLQAAIEAAAKDPQRGRPCPEIRAGYFKLAAGSHLVFYVAIAGGIDVKRILHQRMDLGRHL